MVLKDIDVDGDGGVGGDGGDGRHGDVGDYDGCDDVDGGDDGDAGYQRDDNMLWAVDAWSSLTTRGMSQRMEITSISDLCRRSPGTGPV